ncbi:MAG: protein kinase family protein [Planctomycetes bacterium]|nr:protein kinase family protein [Planctomycetota bacterium]
MAKIPPVPTKIFRPPEDGDVIEWRGEQFSLGKQLGVGAFGTVFDCTDEWGNSLVAKVLTPCGRTYEQVRASWELELSNLMQLRHPNITYVHAAFECDDTFYLIVEKCFATLEEFIANPHVTGDAWLLHVARDILHGLDFIHAYGYVHKDLHAANVFVAEVPSRIDPDATPEWIFKIGDLGISKLEGDIRLFGTVMAQWMLPPEYLDPPQFGVLGKHVDIYHTGLLLLGLLTNCIPSFTEAEILAGRPREVAEALPSPYGIVIAKALRRHVHQRTQSAIEFWRDLRDA